MTELKIIQVSQYLDLIINYPNIAWIYRGHADESWSLIPSAGRPDYFLAEYEDEHDCDFPPRDIGRFNYWRKLAIAYNKDLPANDFECLAYAQHYGLATRLLDWSTNPLVALFFSVDTHFEVDGCVYCYFSDKVLDSNKAKLGDLNVVCSYDPPPIDNRVLMQAGVFTYHPIPNKPLKAEKASDEIGALKPDHGMNLVKVIVEKKMKHIIKRQLDEIGINRKSLFPDLEGLSNYVNWGTNRGTKQ